MTSNRCCLVISIVGGIITGTIVSQPWFEPVDNPFEDDDNWEVCEDPEVDRIQELEARGPGAGALCRRQARAVNALSHRCDAATQRETRTFEHPPYADF